MSADTIRRDFCGLSEDELTAQYLALLPEGPVWPRDPDTVLATFFRAAAKVRIRLHERACALVGESVLCNAVELLPAYEADYGLPDGCDPYAAERSIPERQLQLCDKETPKGGQSIPYFESVAARLGYTIEVEEMRAAICGLSDCGGEDVCGDETLRFWWRVRVAGPRVVWAECGLAACSDTFATIAHAEDLECRLRKIMPAHTGLIFAYEG